MLRRVAGELQASVRTEDLVARFGGEEFVVMTRGIDAEGAKAFAERIRAIIARALINAESTRVPVTMSLGVAHTQNAPDINTADMLIEAADVALYAAKRGGRNRVEVAYPGRYTTGGTAPTGAIPSPAPKDPRRQTNKQPTSPQPQAPTPPQGGNTGSAWQQVLKQSKKDRP